METASAMGSATASPREAMYGSTVRAAADVTTVDPTAKCRVHGCGRHASVVATPGVEARTAMEAMEPRPSANKDSAGEILWPIEAIRRASVGVIIIVAIGAHRSRTHVGRTHSDRDSKSLGMRIWREHQAKAQQRQKF